MKREVYIKSPIFEGLSQEGLKRVIEAYDEAVKNACEVVESKVFASSRELEEYTISNPCQPISPYA